MRHNDAFVHQVIHGKEQQRNSSQALLTINDKKFLIMTVWIIDRNKTAKEGALTVASNNFHKVIKKLLAVLHLPVVISLVNRNDKALVRSFHIFYKLAF